MARGRLPTLRAADATTPRRWVRAGAVTAGLAATLAAANVAHVQRLRRRARPGPLAGARRVTVGEGLGAPVKLLVLGDSAARGYGLERIDETFPRQVATRIAARTGRRVDVASVATDGHRTVDVLDEQVPLVRLHDPDVVVVAVGVNDAVRVTRRRALAAATTALCDGLRAAVPDALVALVTCPDLGRAPGFPRPLRWLVGWRCRRVAAVQRRVADDAGLAVVSLGRASPSMFGADGFHPGPSGHAAMAAAVADQLVALDEE